MSSVETQIHRRDFMKLVAVAAAGFGPTSINEWFTRNALKDLPATHPTPEMQNVPESVLFGGWFGWHWEHFAPAIAERSQIVTLFPEWEHPTWRREEIRRVADKGKLAMASIGPGGDYLMKDLWRQEQTLSHLLANIGDVPFLMRPFFEMNGNWMQYGSHVNSADEFKDGWRWFCDLVRSHCPQAKLVWSPNVTHASQRYPIEEYYPGDRWVDIVGLDGYNKAQRSYWSDGIEQPNLSFEELFGPDLRLMSRISSRPKIISEVGIAADKSTALSWFTHAMRVAPNYGVKAVCGFWQTKLGWGEGDWNLLGLPNGQKEILSVLREHPSYIHTTLTTEEMLEQIEH